MNPTAEYPDYRKLLLQQGVLPERCATTLPTNTEWAPWAADPHNLLSFLLAAWSDELASSKTLPRRRRIARRVDALRMQMQRGAALTTEVPHCDANRWRSWMGERLIWWPHGVPRARRIGLVSSRLSHPLDAQPAWFAVLRGVCRRLEPADEILISARDTTTAPFLDRCRELFRVPLLEFAADDRVDQSVDQWWDGCLLKSKCDVTRPRQRWTASVSPPLADSPEDPVPLRDRLVVAVADQVVAARVRSGGHMERLLRRRLAEVLSASPWLQLAVGRHLVPSSLARSLLELGACQLELDEDSHRDGAAHHVMPMTSSSKAGVIVSLDQVNSPNRLTHWTRSADGPWPDQSWNDYHDSLILARDDADHGPLATLMRIVHQQCLLASARAIRGSCSVVCFTSVDVRQLPQLRTFRQHRRRWDFEPYGISIDADWLIQRGACPVHYGEASDWESLSPSQRPFFQTRWGGREQRIDWSIEQEWRHVGSVDLRQLPDSAAFLFAPTAVEAAQLAAISRWPVAVLER